MRANALVTILLNGAWKTAKSQSCRRPVCEMVREEGGQTLGGKGVQDSARKLTAAFAERLCVSTALLFRATTNCYEFDVFED